MGDLKWIYLHHLWAKSHDPRTGLWPRVCTLFGHTKAKRNSHMWLQCASRTVLGLVIGTVLLLTVSGRQRKIYRKIYTFFANLISLSPVANLFRLAPLRSHPRTRTLHFGWPTSQSPGKLTVKSINVFSQLDYYGAYISHYDCFHTPQFSPPVPLAVLCPRIVQRQRTNLPNPATK